MSDDVQTADAVRGMVISAFAIPAAFAIAAGVFAGFLMVVDKPIPSTLSTLLTAGTGYIFGALPGIAKDYITAKR